MRDLLALLWIYRHNPISHLPQVLRVWRENRKASTISPRIHKVTDLRTGLEHPTRDRKGRFISAKRAAKEIEIASDVMEHYDAREPGYNPLFHGGYVSRNGTLRRVIPADGILPMTDVPFI